MIGTSIGLAGKVASLVPNVLPQASASALTSILSCRSSIRCPISSSPVEWRTVFSNGGRIVAEGQVGCCIFV